MIVNTNCYFMIFHGILFGGFQLRRHKTPQGKILATRIATLIHIPDYNYMDFLYDSLVTPNTYFPILAANNRQATIRSTNTRAHVKIKQTKKHSRLYSRIGCRLPLFVRRRTERNDWVRTCA